MQIDIEQAHKDGVFNRTIDIIQSFMGYSDLNPIEEIDITNLKEPYMRFHHEIETEIQKRDSLEEAKVIFLGRLVKDGLKNK